MAEWDDTDLTPDEVRSIWEAATPVEELRQTELTAASVEVLQVSTTAAPTRVQVHLTSPIPALVPAHQ